MKRSTLYDNEEQFQLVHGAITAARMRVFESRNATSDPEEQEYYRALLAAYDKILVKFQ